MWRRNSYLCTRVNVATTVWEYSITPAKESKSSHYTLKRVYIQQHILLDIILYKRFWMYIYDAHISWLYTNMASQMYLDTFLPLVLIFMLYLIIHCTIQIKDFTLKQRYVETGIHLISRPTHRYNSQICVSVSYVLQVLTTNKTHYIIRLCV